MTAPRSPAGIIYSPGMQQIRCPKCTKVLAFAKAEGVVLIPCRRCATVVCFDLTDSTAGNPGGLDDSPA